MPHFKDVKGFHQHNSTLSRRAVNEVSDIIYEGSSSQAYTIDSILGSDSSSALTETFSTGKSVNLALNYEDYGSIARFGSAYSRTSLGIDTVKSEYVNGVLCNVVTGTGSELRIGFSAITNPNSEAGHPAYFNQTDSQEYLKYDFIIYTGSNITNVFEIVSATASTTYVLITVDGTPDLVGPPTPSFALRPRRQQREAFYSKYPFEEYLIRSVDNPWPSYSADSSILLFAGSAYTAWEETVLALATDADSIGASPQANVMWDRLTPDGIKTLDNNDEILQKFILTLGQSFDQIRLYQEQMAFAHTIGYQDYDHVPRELVFHLARLWGWKLSHDVKNNKLSSYKLALYDHYASGTSDIVTSLSSDDINFERWRRITSSLVRLWKAKGTRKAMQHIMNVYGVPTELLVLNEYIDLIDDGLHEIKSPRLIGSGVFVATGETRTRVWIDPSDGSAEQFPRSNIFNSRFLDLGLSESQAIYNDVYAWAIETDQSVTDSNGTVIVLSAYASTNLYDFEQFLVNTFIPSDGSHRTDATYPLLEAVYSKYVSTSSNAYVRDDFKPFIEFIEENFMDIALQMLPASSRLLAQGVIFENLPLHRQKYQWEPEGNVKQPFNDEKVWNIPAISAVKSPNLDSTNNPISVASSQGTKATASVIAVEPTAFKSGTFTVQKNPITVVSSKPTSASASVSTVAAIGEPVSQPQDTHELDFVETGVVTDISSPYFLYDNAGVSAYTAFTSDVLLITNDNTVDVLFTATNMSQAGMNAITVELFRKMTTIDISDVRSSAYTVIQTVYEGSEFNPRSNNVGTYRLNTVAGLSVGDTMSASSSVGEFINNDVLITNIYTELNTIVTVPPIGLDNLPVGSNASKIGLKTLFNSAVVTYLIDAIETYRIKHNIIIEVIRELYTHYPPAGKRTLNDLRKFDVFLQDLSVKTGIPINTLAAAFFPFYSFTLSELAGCSIVVPYLRDNPHFTLSTDKLPIADTLIKNLSDVTLFKTNEFFDWAKPVQTFTYDQFTQGDFVGWPGAIGAITDTNDRFISGSVTIGGVDSLNANILQDKEEYFIRWKGAANVTSAWTGETYFDTYSGYNVIESDYNNKLNYNGITYFGNYFVYMLTTKEPSIDSAPTNSGQTTTSTAYVRFKGVGDADRLQIQFIAAGDATPATEGDAPGDDSFPSQTLGAGGTAFAYTAITSENWATATTVEIAVKANADDRTSYAVQTTLEPYQWYWWRLNNVKQKSSLFGYTIESITHSEPQLFATGQYKDTDQDEGENPTTPEPPAGGGGKDRPISSA